MNPAELIYDVQAGPEVQVVGIDQDELGLEILDRAVRQSLDRSLARHRGERRGTDRAMIGVDNTGPRRRLRGFCRYFKNGDAPLGTTLSNRTKKINIGGASWLNLRCRFNHPQKLPEPK